MNQSLNKLAFIFVCDSNAEIGISTLQIFNRRRGLGTDLEPLGTRIVLRLLMSQPYRPFPTPLTKLFVSP